MNPILLHSLITIGAFLAMEGVAWFTHKYIMHGILWHLHEDHHNKQSKGFFEHNDYFFLFFALPYLRKKRQHLSILTNIRKLPLKK